MRLSVLRPSGGPYSSQWQAAMDAEMASWKSTGTYGVDYFQTFSPTPKMTNFRVLLHVTAQRDYGLHSLDFSTAFLQGSMHEEIWLRQPPGFIGTFPAGTQWSLQWPVYGLRQAPCEWHDTVRMTLAALGPSALRLHVLLATLHSSAYRSLALSLLARYVASGRHQKVHRDAAKRVLRYLCST
ncbi:unnamed protein product [Closterium sp. NIES-53]